MNLREFYNDKEALKEVKTFLNAQVIEMGVDQMLKGKDTTGFGLASDIIDEAFEHLDKLFGSKSKKKKPEVNEAR
jgi:NAD(P)H-dependent FMN reductase